MRILHLADLHLGKNMNGFSLIEDQHYILEQILSIVETHQTETVLIAGDVFDKAMPSAEAVKLLDDFLSGLTERNQKVFMISGNHDSAQRIAYGGQIMRKADVYVSPVFSGIPEPVTLTDTWGKLNIYLLPFIRPAVVRTVFSKEKQEQTKQEKIEETADQSLEIQSYQAAVEYVIRQIKLDPGSRNVLVAHQFLTNAKPSESEEFSVGGMENIDASLFGSFDYTALGHIHRAQKVLQETIRYAGTPLKYSFSEAGQQKSVTLVDLEEKGKVQISEIPLTPLRDCREIHGSYREVTAREQYQQKNTQDFVHVILTDEEEIFQAVSKLRLIYPNLMKLDYDNSRTRQNRIISAPLEEMSRSPMDLFEEFYELQNNQPMTQEQKDYAQELLNRF